MTIRRKHYLTIGVTILLLLICLCLLARPRVSGYESISTEGNAEDVLPEDLKEKYLDLAANYAESSVSSGHIEIACGQLVRLKVRALFFLETTFYFMPCYVFTVIDVPSAGTSHWATEVYLFTSGAEQFPFNRCSWSIKNTQVTLSTGSNTSVITGAISGSTEELSVSEDGTVAVEASFDCQEQETLFIDFPVATTASHTSENQATAATVTWEYSLYFNQIQIGYVIENSISAEYLADCT